MADDRGKNGDKKRSQGDVADGGAPPGIKALTGDHELVRGWVGEQAQRYEPAGILRDQDAEVGGGCIK
jgi:hypothetical protein